jgi:hypothetical protein
MRKVTRQRSKTSICTAGAEAACNATRSLASACTHPPKCRNHFRQTGTNNSYSPPPVEATMYEADGTRRPNVPTSSATFYLRGGVGQADATDYFGSCPAGLGAPRKPWKEARVIGRRRTSSASSCRCLIRRVVNAENSERRKAR